MSSQPGQCSRSHSLITLQLLERARKVPRIMTHLMDLRSKPETHLKSANIIWAMGRCLSWLNAMPMSSAHALTLAREESSNWSLNVLRRGSMAMTNNDPERGQPSKTPDQIINTLSQLYLPPNRDLTLSFCLWLEPVYSSTTPFTHIRNSGARTGTHLDQQLRAR